MIKKLTKNITGVKMQFSIAGLVVFATSVSLNKTRYARNF
jgi:hypothetical protein